MIEITKWEFTSMDKYIEEKYGKDSHEYYRVTTGYIDSFLLIANEMGKKGWEMTTHEINNRPIFKRPCGRLKMIEKVNGQEINPE